MVRPLSICHRSCIRLPLHGQYLLVQGNHKSLADRDEIIHLLDWIEFVLWCISVPERKCASGGRRLSKWERWSEQEEEKQEQSNAEHDTDVIDLHKQVSSVGSCESLSLLFNNHYGQWKSIWHYVFLLDVVVTGDQMKPTVALNRGLISLSMNAVYTFGIR